ncbi:MAG: hypothetical protein M0007_00125 [Actinomycetota bacterium]|nr:hypothetical protein [Actinomycetota bacterium]
MTMSTPSGGAWPVTSVYVPTTVPAQLANPHGWAEMCAPLATGMGNPADVLLFIGQTVPALFVAHDTGEFEVLAGRVSADVLAKQRRIATNPYAGWSPTAVDTQILGVEDEGVQARLSMLVTTYAVGPDGASGADSEAWDLTVAFDVQHASDACGVCGAPYDSPIGTCRYCGAPSTTGVRVATPAITVVRLVPA